MAPSKHTHINGVNLGRTVVLLVLFVTLCQIQAVQPACQFPEYYGGNWYHRESGKDSTTFIDPKQGKWDRRECIAIKLLPNTVSEDGQNATIILKTTGTNCYTCMNVIYRSAKILQYSRKDCNTHGDINQCPGFDRLPIHTMLITMFNKEIATTDCISSIEGLYQFSYETVKTGGGICNNTGSELDACQVPGSPNYDNKNLIMQYKACRDIGRDEKIMFKCMGTWIANIGLNVYKFVALANDATGTQQNQFKCLMTLRDQRSEDNLIRWGLSRFGDCRNLKSLDNSPIKIVLRRKAPNTRAMEPRCSLPRNLTGTWFTQGKQFTSEVRINDTHIYYKTKLSQYDYEETWFSCQAMSGSRFLMTKVVVGRCEVNYVCYDIMPRHQGIVRYRVGRPLSLLYKETSSELNSDDYRIQSFRQACSWQWLTFKRDNADWKYEVLIQDPPTPITCPIGGRYYFSQVSDDALQLYDTRIRGITIRPRVRIHCSNNRSVVKSCEEDRSRLEVDTWYCETLDYRGKPIGEYEEPDHILTCVGYWLEDMKSYLITYDEEDAVSKYRCWVYERTSWTTIDMSRAETARCPKEMTSTSYQIDGSRFRMQLVESERLFDDCPQRFLSGIDVGLKPLTVFTLYDGNSSVVLPNIFLLTFLIMSFFFYLFVPSP